MVMPALLSGGFLLALGSIWRAREIRLGELVREQEELIHAAPDGEDPATRKRAAKLEKDILRGQKPLLTADRLPRPRTNPVRFGLLVALAIGLVLVVPFSIGSLAWPVVLVGLLSYWLHLRPDRLSPGQSHHFPIWRLALAAVIGAVTISVARQTDRPVELLSVRAEVKNPSQLVVQTLDLHNARVSGGRTVGGDVSGILVAITGREIAIGDPTDRVIASLPRSSVTSLTIGPPLDQRAPPASLLSRLLHNSGWAVTPLELWCGNVRYGWSRIGHACQLAPEIEAEDALTIRENRIRGIRVSCPEDAEEGCRGFILVVTVKPVDTTAPSSSRSRSRRRGSRSTRGSAGPFWFRWMRRGSTGSWPAAATATWRRRSGSGCRWRRRAKPRSSERRRRCSCPRPRRPRSTSRRRRSASRTGARRRTRPRPILDPGTMGPHLGPRPPVRQSRPRPRSHRPRTRTRCRLRRTRCRRRRPPWRPRREPGVNATAAAAAQRRGRSGGRQPHGSIPRSRPA